MFNALFVVVDCLRADHLSAYGYERQTTPNIDQLAGRSVVVRRAITQSTWTVSAAASMLTGLYPEVHGAVGFYDRLANHFVTLPQYLSAHGFDTICFDGTHIFEGPWGLGRGFTKIESSFIREKASGKFSRLKAEEVYSKFADYLASSRPNDHPFLSILWFAELHDPEIMPEEKRRYFRDGNNPSVDQYDSAIRYVDYYIGEVLEALNKKGLLDNTFIVVTADHGEVFDQHYWLENRLIGRLFYNLPCLKKIVTRNGHLGHGGIPPWEGVLNVPLILKFPKEQYKGVIQQQVELIDLFPTTLAVLNLKTKRTFWQGRSIIHDLVGNNPTNRRIAFSYTKPTDASALFTCAGDGEFKFVKVFPPSIKVRNVTTPKVFITGRLSRGEYLFKTGTTEKHDFSKEQPERLRALTQELLLWRRKNKTLKEKIRISNRISREKFLEANL